MFNNYLALETWVFLLEYELFKHICSYLLIFYITGLSSEDLIMIIAIISLFLVDFWNSYIGTCEIAQIIRIESVDFQPG